jgi:hypothetical protein
MYVRACVGVAVWARACACARVTLLIQHESDVILSLATSMSPSYFSTLSKKRDTIFGKSLLNIKYVSIFSATFICKISHSKGNLERYCHKCENVFG